MYKDALFHQTNPKTKERRETLSWNIQKIKNPLSHTVHFPVPNQRIGGKGHLYTSLEKAVLP